MTTTTLAPWITRPQAGRAGSALRQAADRAGAMMQQVKDMPRTPAAPVTAGRPGIDWGVRPATENTTPSTAAYAPAVTRTTRTTRWAGPTARPAPTQPAAQADPRPTFREMRDRIDAAMVEVPVGFYALPRRAEVGAGQSTYFFKVEKYRTGKRIVQVTGGVGAWTTTPMKMTWQLIALEKIAKDLAGAAKLFGDKTSTCGFCAAQGRMSPLTRDRSVAAGYGEHCAKKHGLPW